MSAPYVGQHTICIMAAAATIVWSSTNKFRKARVSIASSLYSSWTQLCPHVYSCGHAASQTKFKWHIMPLLHSLNLSRRWTRFRRRSPPPSSSVTCIACLGIVLIRFSFTFIFYCIAVLVLVRFIMIRRSSRKHRWFRFQESHYEQQKNVNPPNHSVLQHESVRPHCTPHERMQWRHTFCAPLLVTPHTPKCSLNIKIRWLHTELQFLACLWCTNCMVSMRLNC